MKLPMIRKCLAATIGYITNVFCGCALALGVAAANAEDAYPARPIRLIVPYAPGGVGDSVSRAYASELTKVLGKTIVVDNRPGAGTAIGVQAAKAAPDNGYTLLFSTDGMIATMLSLKSPGYRMEDFVPIALLGEQYYVLMTPTAIPARDLREFVVHAKQNPRTMNYAILGPGAASHVLADRLARTAGFSWAAVAYRGASPALNALMRNEVQGYFTTQSSALSLRDSDKVRALAFAAEERGAFLPDVPTFKELGYSAIADLNWYAMLVRSSTPPQIVERLRKASAEVLRSTDMTKHQKTLGLSPSKIPLAKFPAVVDRSSRTKAEELKRLGVVQQ